MGLTMGCGLSKMEWEQLEARRQQCLKRQNMLSKLKTTVTQDSSATIEGPALMPGGYKSVALADLDTRAPHRTVRTAAAYQQGKVCEPSGSGWSRRGSGMCRKTTLETYKTRDSAVSI